MKDKKAIPSYYWAWLILLFYNMLVLALPRNSHLLDLLIYAHVAYTNIRRYIRPVNICPGGRSAGAYINRGWICQRQPPILHSANTPTFQNHPCCNIVQQQNLQFKTRSTGMNVAQKLQTSQRYDTKESKNVFKFSLVGCSKQHPIVGNHM